MELITEEISDVAIVKINGEFNIGNVNTFEEYCQGLLNKNPKTIAINAKDLQYIDSSAIGTLVKFLNSASSKNIKMVIFDLSDSVLNIFKTARLDNFFTIITKQEFDSKFL